MERTPFGEVGAARLQHLQSMKNHQNAVSPGLANPLKAMSPTAGVKRSVERVFEDEAFDTENVDPEIVNGSKKTKNSDGTVTKKSLFNLNLVSKEGDITTVGTPTMSSAPAITSTPAGRSPPRPKRVSALSKGRGVSSSRRHAERPSERMKKTSSLDNALHGSFGKSDTTLGKKSGKSMPKGWFFDIHVDSAQEEACNIMEHSAGILDISSDDEGGPSKKDDKGKENVAPPDYEVYLATVHPTRVERPRGAKARHSAKVDLEAMITNSMEDRSPLAGLEDEEFYPPGLDQSSVEVIPSDETVETEAVRPEAKSSIHVAVDEEDRQ
ncbi:MAG: hypothetical protein M1831_002360 [Alyxoria varia]|nr:MAG: hypothetical protein M1831_002360 [Alyxoria varia]